MLEIVRAELERPAYALLEVLSSYARDPMGGGRELALEVGRQGWLALLEVLVGIVGPARRSHLRCQSCGYEYQD